MWNSLLVAVAKGFIWVVLFLRLLFMFAESELYLRNVFKYDEKVLNGISRDDMMITAMLVVCHSIQ